MSELSFAKQFLSTLDSKPTRLQVDHVEDPKNYPMGNPYILPKMPHAMKKGKKVNPGQEPAISVTLKSLRNPPLDITLPAQSVTTSVADLKTSVVEKTGAPIDKVRLLLKKRPCQDSKILKELVEEDADSIEFSVMIMGGMASLPPKKEDNAIGSDAGPDTRTKGAAAIETEDFWADLKGFLMQRLGDEKEATSLASAFRSSIKK